VEGSRWKSRQILHTERFTPEKFQTRKRPMCDTVLSIESRHNGNTQGKRDSLGIKRPASPARCIAGGPGRPIESTAERPSIYAHGGRRCDAQINGLADLRYGSSS
jgi:hypothetical protein